MILSDPKVANACYQDLGACSSRNMCRSTRPSSTLPRSTCICQCSSCRRGSCVWLAPLQQICIDRHTGTSAMQNKHGAVTRHPLRTKLTGICITKPTPQELALAGEQLMALAHARAYFPGRQCVQTSPRQCMPLLHYCYAAHASIIILHTSNSTYAFASCQNARLQRLKIRQDGQDECSLELVQMQYFVSISYQQCGAQMQCGHTRPFTMTLECQSIKCHHHG